MRATPRDDPRPEWGKFDMERWRGSPLYRELKPHERLLATCLFVWQTQKGPIINEDAEVMIAGQGCPADEVYDCLQKSGFDLAGGLWRHPVAMAYFEDSVRQIDARRRGGRKSQELQDSRKDSSQDSSQDSCKESPPVPSRVVVEVVEKEITVPVVIEKGQGQMSLVPVEPRKADSQAEALAIRYLEARHMRLHGTGGNRKAPSRGMVASVTARMIARLREGYEPELLVSLPVLVDDAALAFMLKDPEILLRTDNAQGGKCHARRYEAGLNGMSLGDRQVAILRNIGTLDYVKRSGAKARNWEAGA